MASIFSIPTWKTGKSYIVDDIVIHNGLFYYSLFVHSAVTFSTANFGGIDTDGITPNFHWNPQIGTEMNTNFKVKETRFGDGYRQISEDGISGDLLTLNLVFDKLTDKKATAIAHFIRQRKGTEKFYFTAPEPFNNKRMFLCNNLPYRKNFVDNNTLNLVFQEVSPRPVSTIVQ